MRTMHQGRAGVVAAAAAAVEVDANNAFGVCQADQQTVRQGAVHADLRISDGPAR